uniref:Uncharacterized protein n=1 Tax=Arundo donax TaxID=35708 RepID=A0A0A9CCF7_ARUDO
MTLPSLVCCQHVVMLAGWMSA